MGLLEKIFGSRSSGSASADALNELDDEDVDVLHAPPDHYIKPFSVRNEGDVAVVEAELASKNVVLLDIAPAARNQQLKGVLGKLKAVTRALNGDMARISEDKIIVAPAGIRIVKRTKRREGQ